MGQKSVDPSVGVLEPFWGEGLPSSLPPSVLDTFPAGARKHKNRCKSQKNAKTMYPKGFPRGSIWVAFWCFGVRFQAIDLTEDRESKKDKTLIMIGKIFSTQTFF